MPTKDVEPERLRGIDAATNRPKLSSQALGSLIKGRDLLMYSYYYSRTTFAITFLNIKGHMLRHQMANWATKLGNFFD